MGGEDIVPDAVQCADVGIKKGLGFRQGVGCIAACRIQDFK